MSPAGTAELSLAEQNQVGFVDRRQLKWQISNRLWHRPISLEKRTSAASKAVKGQAIYGTAEAVPFVRQSLPQGLRVSKGFICCRIG